MDPSLCDKVCGDYLQLLFDNGVEILVDARNDILNQYRNNIPTGSYLRRIFQFMLNYSSNCSFMYVDLEQCPCPNGVSEGIWYSNIPTEVSSYRNLHNDDRTFLSLALQSIQSDEIEFISTDTDWCELKNDLESTGVNFYDICEVCEDCL